MKAIKDNKEYTVTNESKQHYIDTGFDIVDENGDIIEYGRGKMVSLEEHNQALERIKELEKGKYIFGDSTDKIKR